MGFPCLPERPGLPEGGDTYNSGFSDMDCLAENCQAQCTETSISHTGDTRCRNYKLRSGRARGFGGWAGIKEVKPLPYPRCWVLTCRLMPTMERRTLPQLGHRHLYITFTEFWQRDGPCHPVTSGSVPSTGCRSTQATLLVLGPHPPTSSTFLLRGAGSSMRKGSESVSKPSSAWGELRASLEYLGLPAGWGGEGVEMSLPPLQCPLVVLLPLSETSPLSFQGSHAAREAAGRGHVLPPSTRGQTTPPPGQRPALRLDNPQQQFASIYLFF